ncbi:hypothetical protein D083_3859 [Dickeya solani RNS 08.23.3.1.A]|nr:hypothetical protein D083_3859 [Dickeya solani RNS 08.23.3.1.A]
MESRAHVKGMDTQIQDNPEFGVTGVCRCSRVAHSLYNS